MTLKLFGCSFTNWVFPTWADFVKLHYDIDVKIYGRPSLGNDALKRLLLTKTQNGDHALLMWTGNDRLDHAIDIQYSHNTLKYPAQKNPHWSQTFAYKDQVFVPLSTPGINFKDHFSLFHALYKQAEVIVDVQNYFRSNNIKYSFLSWQDLFSDLSYRKDRAGIGKPLSLSKYQKNPLFDKIYKLINQNSFLDNPRVGLLNYVHNDRELRLYQNSWDAHPNSYGHFRYFLEFIKPELDLHYKNHNNLAEIEKNVRAFSDYYKTVDCRKSPFFVNGDNDFIYEKFYETRDFIIKKFFNEHLQKLTEGYYRE
jgi:hypothetical protein